MAGDYIEPSYQNRRTTTISLPTEVTFHQLSQHQSSVATRPDTSSQFVHMHILQVVCKPYRAMQLSFLAQHVCVPETSYAPPLAYWGGGRAEPRRV